MFEYLEKHCADAYKREFDQDENVHRSLPFFVATLAFQMAILTQVSPRLPRIEWGFFPALIYGLLACWAWLIFRTIRHLFAVVSIREYRTPPLETEVLAWAREQRDYWLQTGAPRIQVEEVVAEEAREHLAEEFAEAVAHNRPINAERFRARANALVCVIFALVIVLLIGGATFSQRKFEESRVGDSGAVQTKEPPPQDGALHEGSENSSGGREERSASPQDRSGRKGDGTSGDAGRAGPRGNSRPPEGNVPAPSPGKERIETPAQRPVLEGGPALTDSTPKQPAPSSSSNSDNGKPAQQPASFPQHQLLKKSEDGGRLITRKG